jgi:hypothetical protein
MAKKPQAPRLRPQLEAFVRFYDRNGGNGVEAYLRSHVDCHSRKAAATGAWTLLRNPEIQRRLETLAAGRWRRVQMDGDEALARVALDARADIRQLFDEHNQLLPIQEWPDSVAQSVKALRQGKDGPIVTMNDSLAARRMILEQQGKLKNTGAAIGELARLLTGDLHDPDGEN